MSAAAPPIRVLVADDEPHIRRLVRTIVESLGGQVVAEAGDGEQALARCLEGDVELAILDINMPRLTGEEVLRRAIAGQPRMLGVMMTAQDSVDVVRRCLEIGACNYLLKSNSAEELHRLLGADWDDYASRVEEARA